MKGKKEAIARLGDAMLNIEDASHALAVEHDKISRELRMEGKQQEQAEISRWLDLSQRMKHQVEGIYQIQVEIRREVKK